jgi:hypothetical protein
MYVRRGAAPWLGLVVGLVLLGGACAVNTEPSSNPPPEPDAGDTGDAGKDGGRDADTGEDSGKDGGPDAGEDSGKDGGKDGAPPDAAEDSGPPDSGPDASDLCAGACGEHASCAVVSREAVCSCETGYQDHDGDGTCSAVCASGSCGANSSCSDASGTIVCSCDAGYQDHDGNGTCTANCTTMVCPAQSTCSDATGTAVCACNAGYSGDQCTDTNACAVVGGKDGNPCNGADAAGTCQDLPPPSTSYSCTCSIGFAFEAGTCVLADECVIDNGGCGHPLRAACSDTLGAPAVCTCAEQYGGPACQYHQVYGLDLPAVSPGWTEESDVPYDIDNTAAIAPYDRVVYRLQLDDRFVWVELDRFSDDPALLGVPADVVWDQAIQNVTVLTNDPNVAEVSNAPGGKIEFWSHCYGPGADNKYDHDDERQAIDCFGSMQLHLAGSTLLAVNHWAALTEPLGLGIGSAVGIAPDWTFGNNGESFTTRRLEIFVRELTTCNANSCDGRGTCDDSPGVVQCDCDDGYSGTHCKRCADGYQDNDADGTCKPRCAANSCTVPGEYCFDDSGAIDCAVIDGTGCSAIKLANAAAADGTYVVDFDGAGPYTPQLVYCDMSHGGYTLLAVANAHSRAFGNGSPVWAASDVFGSTPIGLAGGDYKGRAYSELASNVIRLCRSDFSKCHDFAHGQNIALRTFFADDISYAEYSFNVADHPVDVGSDALRVQYLMELGASQAQVMCGYWLGINEQLMGSAIGLIGDNNEGCGAGTDEAWIDDLAIGVGLQSCNDNNSCAPGGSGHTAGRQYRWSGELSDVGPWLMLGK